MHQPARLRCGDARSAGASTRLYSCPRVILATPVGGIIGANLPCCTGCPWRRSQKEGAMTEHNFTEREDRLVGICLAALAIIVVFIFVTSG